MKKVFPVDCLLSILPAVLEMYRDADLWHIINPEESNLLRTEGVYCSEIGLIYAIVRSIIREKVQILGEGK